MECARGGDLSMEIKKYKRLRMSIPEHRIWTYIQFIIVFSVIFPYGKQFAFTGSSGTHSTISLQSDGSPA